GRGCVAVPVASPRRGAVESSAVSTAVFTATRRSHAMPLLPSRGALRPHAPMLLMLLTLLLLGPAAGAAAPPAPSGLTRDMSGYARRADLVARQADGVLAVEWAGTGGERVSLRLGARGGAPLIEELALQAPRATEWITLGTQLGLEYRVVEGLRRISN